MGKIATIEELLAHLAVGGQAPTRVDKDALGVVLDGAEDLVQQYCGRQFYPEPDLVNGADTASPVTKSFKLRSKGYVRVPDLREVDSVTLNGNNLGAQGIYFDLGDFSDQEPATYIKLMPWTAYSPTALWTPLAYSHLEITGRWGFLTAPPAVKNIVLKLAARDWRQRDAMWGDAVQTQEGAIINYIKDIPDIGRLSMWRVPRVALV